MHVYVNSTLVFDGLLGKGCGNQASDYSTTITLQDLQLPECTSPSTRQHNAPPREPDRSDADSRILKVASGDMPRDSSVRGDPPLPGNCGEPVTTVTTQPGSHRAQERPAWLETQNRIDSKHQRTAKHKLSILSDVPCGSASVCGHQLAPLANTRERNRETKPEREPDLLESLGKGQPHVRAVSGRRGSARSQVKPSQDAETSGKLVHKLMPYSFIQQLIK